MEQKNNDGFSYTYSAREQAEIRKIREKYINEEKEEDQMTRLRKLDAKVAEKAQIVSLVFGIIGTLIFGLGLSFVMSDLGALLGAYQNLAMPLGVIIGILGGILLSLAYPMYNFTLERERKKIAPEIIRLSNELMK